MSKLLVLTSNINDYNPKRIEEEAEKRGVETDLVQYHDVDFLIGDEVKILVKGRDLREYDYLILRGTGGKNFDFYMQRDAVVAYCEAEEGIKVLNEDLFVHFPGQFDKLLQTVVLAKAGLPVIESRIYGHFDRAFEAEQNLPVVLKKFVGSHGAGVKKINTVRGLYYFLGMFLPWKAMFQPFLKTGEDYRVIVIGGKVLGAMKRIAQDGAYLTNVSAGGKFEGSEVNEELGEMAIKAAKAFEADYCGVDVMYDGEGRPFVLEVNKAAEFKGFEASTGLNVAGAMVDFLVNK